MKILLYSNHEWTEKSFPFILKSINRAKGLNFTDIKRVPAPTDVPPFILQANGYKYPDWQWFYHTLTKPYESEYDLIVWHVERKEGLAYQRGASKKYNGVYDSQTKDTVFNCFVSADNKASDARTKAHHKLYPKMTDFERVFLHEVSHGTSRFWGQDQTHVWDYELHNIPGYFATQDVSQYKEKRIEIGLWQKILELTKQFKKKKLVHPVAGFRVSQPYGVPNPRYRRVKHHIGTDYATPVGTPVVAPADGETFLVGSLPTIGNYILYRFPWGNKQYIMRCGHLHKVPKQGKFKQGDFIAVTGNSGDSTAPHLHIDLWDGDFNLSALTATNFREWTLDFEQFFKDNQ